MRRYHGKAKNYSLARELLTALFTLLGIVGMGLLLAYALIGWI
jgi:hypothetical protein